MLEHSEALPGTFRQDQAFLGGKIGHFESESSTFKRSQALSGKIRAESGSKTPMIHHDFARSVAMIHHDSA